MPLSGGSADKFGNLYEGRWAVKCLLDLIDESKGFTHLKLEPPEVAGFEFYLITEAGIKEFHQVKTGKTWSIADFSYRSKAVDAQSVWDHFVKILRENSQNSCYFLCNNGCPELDEICERAQKHDLTEFETSYLSGKIGNNFNKLCTEIDRSEVHSLLSRVTADNRSLGAIDELLESRVRNLMAPMSSEAIKKPFRCINSLYT